ncbi:MAG: BglII/BstYI family type II restriction endonuclease [Chloroflexota bacterium]|nr:BglII/BstYI family type II restriction endonuclease [Chloroflexota bacterium]
MKFRKSFFHCGEYLRQTLSTEISEIEEIIGSIAWEPTFNFKTNEKVYQYQTGYNKAFTNLFLKQNWENQPLLRKSPRLIGDFRKGLVFVEIQFGNSATLYRDYYKFQYGLYSGLLSLAVHIVPTNPIEFFPTRPRSISNMANYKIAHTCFSVLPINVPLLLIGLLPEN